MGDPIETVGLAESPVIDGRAAEPTTDGERVLAEVVRELLSLDQVSVDSDFFEELGADSMVMARVCARVRKRGELPPISMKDVYAHPTIRTLAAALQEQDGAGPSVTAPTPTEAPARASARQYILCGGLQFLAFLAYAYLAALTAGAGFEWISAGAGTIEIYLRAVLVGTAGFLLVCAVPIVAKWLLIGRWKPQQIPIWSLAYVRFWIVKTLLRLNPCALLFVGSPLYPVYLRALGAKVGRDVAIFSRALPICTDLLTIGAGTVIRRESFFQCYRAHAGRIEIGPVTLGRDAFVGEKTVLDINTSMGDASQLGHSSALHSGQAVPAGERWHGSPAERTEVNYRRVPPAHCGPLRKVSFCLISLLAVLLLYLPLVEGGLLLLGSAVPSLNKALDPAGAGVTGAQLLIAALALSATLFFGAVLIGLPLLVGVSRVLNFFIKPDTVYPLYGIRDRVHRSIARLNRIRLFTYLCGDSAYIVHYLQALGVRLSPVDQTGSNFGNEVMQANPSLSSVGTGTIVASGLAMINDEISSTSFRVSKASIGTQNFLGNNIVYPAGGRTGNNCLLAIKVMVPLDGEIREGTGLLGSPPFRIPRTVDRDTRFDHLRMGAALRRGLSAKTRYNLRTMGIFLLARWLGIFVVTLLDLTAFELYGVAGHAVMAMLLALSIVGAALYFALVERCILGFGSLKPTYCSIYHRDFWLNERLWKVPLQYLHVFDGTPFKGMVWRLMGAHVGKRLFDDGCRITDRTLTTIGDDCVLNVRSVIQCHSEEDATFKSDASTLGSGCTLGVGAFVHYGVTMGDGAVLDADSFLMKGEEVPAGARWGGNPATET